MKIKPAFILLLFVLSICRAYAQGGFSINGKVTSADSKQPLHAVSITIDRKGVGTATNKNGDFVLLVPAANVNDSLRVSCIGYQTRFLAIASLNNGQPANIALKQNNTQLKEVSVEYHDPLKVIEKAISRIGENYINHPHITRGFYRMYTAKGNEPLELSEAVFDIYNFGYADKRADLFRLIKARDEKNQRDFHSIEVGQKPNTIFNYDVVNHMMSSGFLSERGMKKHKFEFGGVIDVKGYPAYEIDFSELSGAKDESFRGKFYVDAKTYAFIYFDYGLSPTAIRNVEFGTFADRILMGIAGINIGMKSDRTQVGYQKVGDKWVIADVVGNNSLSIKAPSMNYDFVADVKFNYQVTSVDTVQTTSFDTKMGRHENINDHDSNAGEEFWKDYNILLSDFKTEDVFKHIQAVNSETKLKDKFEEKLRKLPKDTVQRLDALFKFYHDNDQFNGTVLIKNKGKVILSKSYGYADKEKRAEANGHTTYRIGSTAKTFTSVIINQLVAEGKIKLSAPVKTYLPEYANGDVTIEQLLTHQSGIPDYFTNDEYKAQIITKSFSLKEMVINFCSDTLHFKSGTEFEYSNSNFTVLAYIAQEVTGKPFDVLLQERIFTPLQMTDTYFGNRKATGGESALGYNDYKTDKPEFVYDAANTAGAGGIYSSAEDLLKYNDALQSDKLLTKEQKAEMLKPRVEFTDYNAWYDYGWMTDKNAFDASQKHVITYHPGTDLGFYTMFTRQEDTDSCIILLNNMGDFPRYDMTDLILDILN